MNIAIIGNYFPPHYGGVEMFTTNIARELAALGHRTTLLCAGGNAPKTVCEGKLETRLLRSLDIMGMPIMPSLLTSIPVDVDCIHATMPSPLGPMVAWALCRLRDKPLVVSVHSLPTRYGPLSDTYNKLILPRILKSASFVVTPSRSFFARTTLAPLFSTIADKISSIPNAVDLEVFRPDSTLGLRTKEEYALPERTILFVGVLDGAHWYKGLEYLLQAVRELRKNIDIHLLVVGDGDRRNYFEYLTVTLGLKTNVTFLGRVPSEELPGLYNACDCLVMPSISHTDSFGIVLAEAMACGIPVVASDVGGLSETVGDAGLLVPPGDVSAIIKSVTLLLTDPSLRERVAGRCLERARRYFSWKLVASSYEMVHLNALECKGNTEPQSG